MTSSLRTRAVHAGRDDLTDLGVHAAPLDLSTTYPSRDSAAEAARIDEFAAGGELDGPPIYGRVGNPTVERFERALAELEGFDHGVAFASGMAAVSACLLSAVAQGKRHVVAVRPLYGCSDHLLASGLLGTEVTWAAPDAGAVAAALRPDTGLVFVETPANPTLAEVDIAELARACEDGACEDGACGDGACGDGACGDGARGGVPLVVDNTFATPVLQRPGRHGARMVLHSATKFLGGHGDVMGGIVACDAEEAARLRQIRFATGGVLHPLAGYLLLRGLSTLPLRVNAASATAATLASRLGEHPAVTAVHYPRLGGPLVAFEVDGDPHALIGAVRLITPAVSLGSVDTLIQHPGSISHRIVDEGDRHGAGVSDRLLRMSVGLEDVEDLWADLEQALKAL